jgi:serine/threonine-protein kinase
MPDHRDPGGRLQLHGEIARGGMGAILKGRDTDLGRDIALKVLLETHQGKTELVQRFVEEAQINGQLQHPGIVPIYELGQFADQRPYFTMKLVKGRTLAALLATRKELAEDRPKFIGIFHQVCQTLAYAHARGVIHRDLKPSNVMVGSFGEVQVMDWGLAKVLPQGGVVDYEKASRGRQPPEQATRIHTARTDTPGTPGSHTQAGSVLGTPAYMAPEQARGDVDLVDERSDVFGLGAILCEILTGQPPFPGKGAEALRKAQTAKLDDAYGRLEACGADAELIALARRCLAAEPWDRPRDAGVVVAEVTAYLHSVEARLHQAELDRAAEVARAEEARATAAVAEAKARAERRSRRLTLALAASVLLAGALGAMGWRWVELDRMERVAALEARVNAALQKAVRLRGLAQGATLGDLVLWTEAVAAARHAEALLGPGVNPALQQQAEKLLADVTAEEQRAAAAVHTAERDRRLLEQLVDIRSAKTDDRDGSGTDAANAEAFRAAGFDVVALPPAEVGARLRDRPADVTLALAAALDDWAAVRRDQRKDRGGAKRLSEAAQVADPDPWRRELRTTLDEPDKAKRLAALRALAKNAQLDELGAISLNLLGKALSDAGDAAAAERVLRAAQRRYPGDVWVNYDLAQVLEKLARREEAIRYYMAARALRPETAHELAHALQRKGESDEALVVFQELAQLRPKNGRHLACLSVALRAQGRAQEARTVLDAAIAALRETIKIQPKNVGAHFSLGSALGRQGKHDEAIAAYGEVIRLQPDHVGAHINLGGILCDIKHDYDGALVAFREALRLQPDAAGAHGNVGEVLAIQGKLDEALVAYHETIRLAPDDAWANCVLGHCLRRKGQYAEALAHLQRGHELHSKHPEWEAPTAEWVRQAEQMVALAPKLPALLKGQAQPANAGERLALAQMCADREWYVAAAQFWSEAFAEDPQRADDLQTGFRFHAARAAALAGAGKTQDDPPPDDATKAQLRQQARAWLQADLAAYAKQLDGDDPSRVEPWKFDPQLAGLRDPAAVAKLPAEEQAACKQLWTDVEALLKRAHGKA